MVEIKKNSVMANETQEKDYSFYLMPGGKTRHVAGPFDVKTRKPRYEIEINVPSHVYDRVEVKQFLLGYPRELPVGMGHRK